MNTYTIGIDLDALSVVLNGDHEGRQRYTDHDSAVAALKHLMLHAEEDGDVVICSSSVHFPKSFTKMPWLIDLANMLSK